MTKCGVVLVHGSLHGSWCWERVVEGLAARGVEAVAVDLPGRGSNVGRPTTLAENVAVIREAIDALGTPVVVCGHSAAGIPVSHLEFRDGRVRHLVYIAANLPETPERVGIFQPQLMASVGTRLTIDEHGLLRAASEEAAIELFYSDCSPEVAKWAVERLISDQLVDWTTPGADGGLPAPWKSVPSTYVVCAKDQVLLPSIQRQLAAPFPAAVEFPTGHSPFLSQPELVVDLLSEAART